MLTLCTRAEVSSVSAHACEWCVYLLVCVCLHCGQETDVGSLSLLILHLFFFFLVRSTWIILNNFLHLFIVCVCTHITLCTWRSVGKLRELGPGCQMSSGSVLSNSSGKKPYLSSRLPAPHLVRLQSFECGRKKNLWIIRQTDWLGVLYGGWRWTVSSGFEPEGGCGRNLTGHLAGQPLQCGGLLAGSWCCCITRCRVPGSNAEREHPFSRLRSV